MDSVVRAPAELNTSLTFENISSIGVRSGLHGGNGTTRAPASSTASTTSSALCGLRLSQITTSPGRYTVDEIRGEPGPSGHTSRRWGILLRLEDGAVISEPDVWEA